MVLVACGNRDDTLTGSGASADKVQACSIDAQRRWVDANMRDYYLFYDQVPSLRLSDYDSAESLIKDLRVAPDRFSYVGDAALSEAFFEEGQDFGYGWRLQRRADNALVIALVEPESPLAQAGVVRGDTLLSIDGVSTNSITSNEQAATLFGSGDDVRTVTLGLADTNGVQRDVIVTRGQYSIKAVLAADVLETDTARVGYLAFLTFIETAREELAAAFADFASRGTTELVIDLRHNGGGRIDVANELASRVIGTGGEDRHFLRYRFNDKYQSRFTDQQLQVSFKTLEHSLDLARVYVLTSPGTCSASELVINGLSPFVEVVTIGSSTCGKPYGTQGELLNDSCNKVMHAVEVEFVNDAGVGGYADGLPATCAASDDFLSALGDPADPLLGTALEHLSTGTCGVTLANDGFAERRSTVATGSLNPVDPHRVEFPLR
jgi:C-terminal processing protease CtpA/Prc